MRFLRGSLLIIAGALAIGRAGADPMSEAKAAGQQAISAISSGMQTPGNGWAQPALQALPGGTLPPDDPQDAAVSGGTRMAQCAEDPNSDVSCEGIDTSQASNAVAAATTQPLPADAETIGSGTLPIDSVLGGSIAGAYSGCATQTLTYSSTTTDLEYCYDYYKRNLDSPCTKTLQVEVDWQYSCPAGATGPYVTDSTWSGGDPVPHYCVENVQTPTCDPGSTLVKDGFSVYCKAADGSTSAPHYVTTQKNVDAVSWADTTDHWDDGCAAYEARVPPGLLPPDGVNDPSDGVFDPSGYGGGPIDKCERDDSQCSDPGGVRVIDNDAVYRDCWAYANKFSCVDLDPKSDCNQPRSPSCRQGSTNCVDYDVFNDYCTATRTEFSCPSSSSSSQQIANCSGETYTDAGGNTWDVGHPPDTDLASVTAFLEAGREAGGYGNVNRNGSLDVFKGFDSRCKKKFFGLVNCCNKSNSGSGKLFSDYQIAYTAFSQVGSALTSSYVLDSLYVSDAPQFMLDGLESIFGGGTTSALAGMLAGDVSVESFLSTLVPGPWSIALLAIEYSGILSCSDSDKTTALRRDANLCTDIGEYCSSRLPIIHTCIEHTHTYCCYNSILAKLINTQGKAQLGIGMGSATAPNCDGFTAAQLQRLDLSSMDLSEFMAEVVPDTQTPAAQSCYFQGDTACTPVH